MANSNLSRKLQNPQVGALTSPRALGFLIDNGLAQKLIADLRWGEEIYCPRCHSKFAKKIHSNIYHYLYKCIDCSYMYNQMAGTIFHGAKINTCQFLQLFLIYGALKDNLSIRDAGFALNFSYKTSSILLKKIQTIPITHEFSAVNAKLSDQYRRSAKTLPTLDLERFFAFCEMKDVVVNQQRFVEFLRGVVDTRIHPNSLAH